MTNYHELVKGKVYIGGVDAIQDAVKKHGITEVFDLRAGGEEPEGFPAGTKHHAYPIVEGVEGQDESVKNAIAAVKEAVEQDKKVFFHCSGGRNRTGTVATGLLIELGVADNIKEAEQKVKEIRSIINIKPELREVLGNLYK
ncbi:dual specificity protein phosphatase family protein [Bacillus anthracis]|uniref:protein-tyrosine phosphatase family protein n=1 Tax=Bacillus TaxID=1386 RepID=UPI000A3028B7|nr:MULTISPECIES: dual specificity protein phosphatase [Bacillus]MBC6976005.1 dual specificity protein phosphatase family protein [Bacillus sp. Xin]MBL3793838.1 dual specificity protein phosphatase family protein [Bacillus cereus]MBL3853660.1 dual specificity protein phosphatase family protein [Bacillus cereus]MBL3854420.1 dual specificity protein phosphatase family protein [Bacillus cereus]MCM0004383.1 dual specificity protein phosphatase family protein [Bacillus paranthracis]